MTEPALTAPSPPEEPSSNEPLEQRVSRLEEAVAALQDTRAMEDRITERVLERTRSRPPKVTRRREEPLPETIIAAERRTFPPPEPAAPPAAPEPAPPAEPAPEPAPAAWAVPTLLAPHRWLLFDFLSELTAMVRMFFDIRYRVAWSTRVTVVVLLVLYFTSGWWNPLAWLPLVSGVIDKVVSLILAFFIYKALSREARRYQELRAARPGP